jgi:TFIIF-interacting CTD phosphatase-like protein
MIEFLEIMAEHYTVAIFTASTEEYADAVINQIDPEEKFVSLKLYRQHCTNLDGKIYQPAVFLIILCRLLYKRPIDVHKYP